MDLSRADHVTLRDRLKARSSIERSTNTGVTVQSYNDGGITEEITRAFDSPTRTRQQPQLYSPSKHRSRSVTPTGDAAPRSTAIASRQFVDKMKEKVSDRTAIYGAPTPISGGGGASLAAYPPNQHQYFDAAPAEPTKDVYLHAQPFPVNTVYEVERINKPAPEGGTTQRPSRHLSPPSPNKHSQCCPSLPMVTAVVHQSAAPNRGGGGGSETLLLPEESARLVRTLEDRLSTNLHRVATIENSLLQEEAERKEATERMNTYAHENAQLVSRNGELERQLQIVRAETRDIIDENSKNNVASTELAVEHNTEKWRTVEASLAGDLANSKHHIHEVTRTKLELERMVKELRNQLTQNAGALQTNSQTVKDLTRELLAAKQQASSVSSGYREQEKNLKAATALNHTQKAELESLRNVHADLGESRERASHAEAQLKTAQKQLEAFKESEVERVRLDKLNKEIQGDMIVKNKELQELKQKLELVTNQAHQAFHQSNRFHQMAGADPATAGYYAAGGGGMGVPDPMAVLRQEMEEQERRSSEESRRWRNRLSSPQK